MVAVVPGAAGAFRRAALIDVGGYPGDTLVEDADLTVELLRGGWQIHYEPTALAYTEAPEGVADALRQRRRWAYGTVELLAKHARSMLRPDEGRVGLLHLPWTLLSQVLLPLGGPWPTPSSSICSSSAASRRRRACCCSRCCSSLSSPPPS
ncbi:MAG: hypothetical protein QOD57_2955 [Actinomycetota bacterium]|nr:hypothetical protein [Actinomycetota bacterium]